MSPSSGTLQFILSLYRCMPPKVTNTHALINTILLVCFVTHHTVPMEFKTYYKILFRDNLHNSFVNFCHFNCLHSYTCCSRKLLLAPDVGEDGELQPSTAGAGANHKKAPEHLTWELQHMH